MSTMLAKKVRVSYVLGGTYDIAVDEHWVSTAHEKMRAVADGYRLHPAQKIVVMKSQRVGASMLADSIGRYVAHVAESRKPKTFDNPLDAYRPRPKMRGVPAEWMARDA